MQVVVDLLRVERDGALEHGRALRRAIDPREGNAEVVEQHRVVCFDPVRGATHLRALGELSGLHEGNAPVAQRLEVLGLDRHHLREGIGRFGKLAQFCRRLAELGERVDVVRLQSRGVTCRLGRLGPLVEARVDEGCVEVRFDVFWVSCHGAFELCDRLRQLAREFL